MNALFRDIGKGLLAAKGAPLIGLGVGVATLVGVLSYSPQLQAAVGLRGPLTVVATDTPLHTDTPLPTATLAVLPTATPVPPPDLAVSASSITVNCTRGAAATSLTLTNTGSVGHAWNTEMSNTDFSVHPRSSVEDTSVLAPGASVVMTVAGQASSGTSGQLTILQGGRTDDPYRTAAVVNLICA